MTEKSLPNIFILLDLDPDRPWNQAEFERQLRKKRQEWSRLTNWPGKRGLQAKQNLDLISKLKEIAGDEAQRQAQAAEARRQQTEEQAAQLKQFEEQLDLLQLKGHILEEELSRLVKDFADLFSEKDVRKRLRVPVEKRRAKSRPRQAALDPSKAKNIQRRLESLGRANLYDFLGLSQETESRLLLQQARTLYDGVQKKGKKSDQDTLTSELSGHCLVIFKSEAERAKYKETLRLQEYDGLKAKVDMVARVSKIVDAKQMEQLLREARGKKLDPDEALAIIQEYATKKGYSITISEQAAQTVSQLQRCGHCHHLNEKAKAHCTRCGEPLKEPCPRCGQMVASEDMACGACGFPTGNRSYVMVLINDADQARLRREYSAAATYLEQAKSVWPAGGADTLAKRIRDLETKIVPGKNTQEKLLAQVEVAIQQRRFYEARNLLPQLERVLPADGHQVAKYRHLVEPKIQQAEAKLAQARRARGGDPERNIQIYQEALRICQDCQEAREMLAKTPPGPPGMLRATVGGKVIHLTWQPSRSRGIRYTVVRKKHSRPVSVSDGEQLSTVAGTVYDDSTVEVGVPIFYAVFTDREGVPSKSGAILSQPVMMLREVRKLTARVDDRQVHLRWETPLNMHDVVVVRSAKGHPASLQDDQIVPLLDRSQAVDSHLQNGRRYFYTVFCQFKDYSGKLQTTSGVRIEATPQQPPTPIKELHISAKGPPHARQVQLRWPPPAKGDVVILKSEKPTGLELGEIIPRQDLSKYGEVLATTSNRVSAEINRLGFYYFSPVVVFQGAAYIGREQKYICVDDVSDLSVQNLGHVLRLQWQWPPDCQEVLVAFSYKDWPKANQADAITIPLTRAQYDLHGCYDISNPVQADHYITVFAVISQGGQKIVASGQNRSARKLVSLTSRITLGYEIKKSWLTKRLALHLTIKGRGKLPTLILTRKQTTLPMNKFDGEIILRLESAPIQTQHLTFAIPEGAKRRQSYAKLFLENDYLYDVVTIRHPAREKSRLF